MQNDYYQVIAESPKHHNETFDLGGYQLWTLTLTETLQSASVQSLCLAVVAPARCKQLQENDYLSQPRRRFQSNKSNRAVESRHSAVETVTEWPSVSWSVHTPASMPVARA